MATVLRFNLPRLRGVFATFLHFINPARLASPWTYSGQHYSTQSTLGRFPLDTLKFFNEDLRGNQLSQRALSEAQKAKSSIHLLIQGLLN